MGWRYFSVLGTGLLLACSGSNPNDLLGDGGLSGPDTGTVLPNDDASSPPDDGGSDATVTDANDTKDAQVVVDAAPDVPVGPPDSKVQCGPNLTCSAQTQLCCHHTSSTINPYECVTNASSCAAIDDVPIACSTPSNCASQGNPSYKCCATGGAFGTGQCYNYDVATSVACKPDCTSGLDDYEIGCSVQQQNCSDSLQTCVVSKCTLPGYTMCY